MLLEAAFLACGMLLARRVKALWAVRVRASLHRQSDVVELTVGQIAAEFRSDCPDVARESTLYF